MVVTTVAAQRRIRAVLFDVDGTLYVQPPLRLIMACEMALAYATARTNHERRFARRVAAFRRSREQLRADVGTADCLAHRQYSVVSEQLKCGREEVERAVREWMHERPLKWLKYCRRSGLIHCLDALAASGIRLGVFSDYPAEEKLAALGIRDRFDFALSATDPEIDALKPHPKGFLEAIRRWNVRAEEVLYVGDRIEVDAAGALAAGMACAVIGADGRRPEAARITPIKGLKELPRVVESNRNA